jgi:hypothetical protein
MANPVLPQVDIRAPEPCNIVLNPLHDWASSTYTFTLWWLDIDDYNNLMTSPDVDQALAYELSTSSYVIAEDAGLYPTRRLPSTFGLNFNIEKVQFLTTLALNERNRHSNQIEGKITIVEPYGISLIDAMVAASFNVQSKQFESWVDRPWLLELNFKGWDDAGNPIPDSLTNLYRKRFPIRINNSAITHSSSKGTEYVFDFTNWGAKAWGNEHGKVQTNIDGIEAETVDDFFNKDKPNSFTARLNNYYKQQVGKGYGLADQYEFDINPAIAKSKITFKNDSSLLDAATMEGAAETTGLNINKRRFNIKKDTPIVDIINRILAASEYIIQTQLKLQSPDASGNQEGIFNAFRTVAAVTYQGIDKNGGIQVGTQAFDPKRGCYARKVKYKIHQYSTWTSNHPKLPLFSDSIPYNCKQYDYYYTGQNIDIINMKLDFKHSYFTPVNAFKDVVVAQAATPDSLKWNILNQQGTIFLNPNLFSRLYTQLGAVPTVSPMKILPTTASASATRGFGILNNPPAQDGIDVLRGLYSRNNGDMVGVDITIVGDPTLLKQDDWLYIPSPTESTRYNKWESQTQFMAKYGHMRMDTGEIPVLFNINTILDMDTEYEGQNKGLGFPDPSISQSSSVFSGQYKIVSVDSTFEKGQFTQKLNMTRYINQDYIAKYQKAKTGLRSQVQQSIDLNKLNQSATATKNGVVTLGGTQTLIVNNARE